MTDVDTVGWRGAPERWLPSTLAPLPVQVMGLELSLSERSAID